jgi:hypothetical protein
VSPECASLGQSLQLMIISLFTETSKAVYATVQLSLRFIKSQLVLGYSSLCLAAHVIIA